MVRRLCAGGLRPSIAVLTLALGLTLLSLAAGSAAAAPSILLYDGWTNNGLANQALTRLGYTFTQVREADAGDLDTAVASGGWDLIVLDNPGGNPSLSGFLAYVAGGGRAILSTHNLDAATGLGAAFDVLDWSDYDASRSVWRWNTTHPLFTSPQTVPNPLNFYDTWSSNGYQLTPAAGGEAVGGFSTGPSAGLAAIVIGNDARTIINGPLWDEATGDADLDSITDGVELVMNEVQFLLGTGAGTVSLDQDVYRPGATVRVTVNDLNANTDPAVTETVSLMLTSTTEATGEGFICTEIGTNSGVFTADVELLAGSAVVDGHLQVANGDLITANYTDVDDGAGQTFPRLDKATVDAVAPAFAGLSSALGAVGAVNLTWSAATDTALPVTYLVYRSSTSGGQQFDLAPLGTTTGTTYQDTTATVGQTYYYVVRAQDAAGNRDANTVEIGASAIGTACFWSEPLDTDPGWTCQGQWAFGQPTGWTHDIFGRDPSSGHTGTNVYGYNLSGPYANSMAAQYLTSGPIDCTGYSSVQLRFWRWLCVEQAAYDHAAVEASINNTTWTVIWQNTGGDGIVDSAWSQFTYDLPLAANQATLYLRWRMGPSDSTGGYAGWNIDDIELWGSGGGTGNSAPVLGAVGDKSVDEGQALSFTVTATDAEGDTLTYSATGLPTGATLDTTTGAFSWTPGYSAAGTYPVHFQVSDGSLTDSEDITITVNNANQPPVLDAIGNKTANEMETLSFTLTATDPEGDPLTYSVEGFPAELLNTTTGAFSWTPGYEDSGDWPVRFSVSDGTDTDYEDITITVNQTNRPPVLSAIGDQTATAGTQLVVWLSATDPDGDNLSYSGTNLPTGAEVGADAGIFTWTPALDQGGTYDVTIQVSDGSLTDSETITITVNTTPHAPVLNTIGSKSTDEGTALSFTVSGSDVDGDSLTYSATDLPTGATFDAATRGFSWTPAYDQAGSYTVRFQVSDGSLTDYEDVTITVYDWNRPPVLEVIGAKSVDEGQTLSFTLTASDPDGDSITYGIEGDDFNDTFDIVTGEFTCTPTYTESGAYSVTFSASDGSESDSETITITINEITDPPVLAAVGNKTITEAANLSFSLSATDPDGDSLTYSATGLPDGATLDPATGAFSWTPGYDQSGLHPVTFTVSDGHATDTESITINVYNTNRPPVLDPIGNKTVNEGETLSFTVTASDPDGEALIYTLVGSGPITNTMINHSTGVFTFTPSYWSSGVYTVLFEASDGQSAATEEITLTVNNVNQAPVLSPIGNKTLDENKPLSFTVSASDADGDPVSYGATNLPSGATFNSTTGAFSWTPTYDQSGTYTVHFSATDGSLVDTEDVTITVNNVVATVSILRFAAPKTAAANRSKSFSVVVKNGPYETDIEIDLTRLSPASATVGTQTIHLLPNAKKTVDFTYLFRTADAPSVSWQVTAATPTWGAATATATTRVRP